MNIEDLAQEIEEQGGIAEAIRYGVEAESVPETVRARWVKLCLLLEAFDEEANRLAEMIGVDHTEL